MLLRLIDFLKKILDDGQCERAIVEYSLTFLINIYIYVNMYICKYVSLYEPIK